MSVKLSEIVPWGRSFDEYRQMFNLGPEELRGKILGCGDGPASFNAEMTAMGHSVVSCDPIYAFSPAEIAERFEQSKETVLSQVRARMDNYVWTYHQSPDSLSNHRRAVLDRFVEDFPAGFSAGRYVEAALPSLPFVDDRFDLALCSHLLFLYANLLSLDFHVQSLIELCRVAREVRVFPLVGLDCETSPHLEPVQARLLKQGFRVELVNASYQLQRNGNQFMRITRVAG